MSVLRCPTAFLTRRQIHSRPLNASISALLRVIRLSRGLSLLDLSGQDVPEGGA